MRVLSFLGLLLALVVVGMLLKQQLGAVRPAAALPTADGPAATAPAAQTVREQAQSVQQQYQQAVQGALQPAAPRGEPQ